MSRIRVTKEFNLEMAHALSGYDGKCKNIHGHTYRLFVTIIGSIDNDPASPKNGMVIDFNLLKAIVKTTIIDELDHSLVLNGNTPSNSQFSTLNPQFSNVILVPYQPTCENLLLDFASRIQNALPNNLKLFKLKLSETITSFAEWYASDN